MLDPDENGVIARLEASPLRRLFAVGVLLGLAVLLAWLAVARPPAPGYQALLIVVALVAAYQGERLRRATLLAVELRPDGLVDTDGTVIADLADVERVERGVFAFKPSNGFLVVTRRRNQAGWRPGLWWRFGKSIGVGGVTPAAQAKVMADKLAMMVAQRDEV